MAFLEQFFLGNIDPQSRTGIHPQDMKRLQDTMGQLEQMLYQQLQEPQLDLFQQYTDAWGELNAQSDLDSFVCGFRMGAQMALDTFVVDKEGCCMELTYTKVGDYYYPNLCLPQTNDDRPLGKYGMLRKTYLKQHRPMVYDRLLLAGKLDTHLWEIDDRAMEQVNQMLADLAAKEGVNEQLKTTDQLRWVGLMNNFKAAAEKQVLKEIVYG